MLKIIVANFILLIFLFTSCHSNTKNKNARAFYYWKTTYHLVPQEKNALTELEVKKLYVRFFDVDLNPLTSTSFPKATIIFKDSVVRDQEIIPVVYITNKTFMNSKFAEVTSLAYNIIQQVNVIANKQKIAYKELQIDCDWSEKTKVNYFLFLKEIRKHISASTLLSATIRLHQVKYASITGIPPVNRGMLMFYNIGRLDAKDSGNSIFNKKAAANYIQHISNYLLPLDVALPIFSWAIQVRNGKIIDLINKESSIDFHNDTLFENVKNNCYVARNSFYHRSCYIKKDDLFRIEKLDDKELTEAADMISKALKPEPRTILLFDLDKENLSVYEKEILEEVYNCFN